MDTDIYIYIMYTHTHRYSLVTYISICFASHKFKYHIAIIYKLLYILPCQTLMQLSPVTGDRFKYHKLVLIKKRSYLELAVLLCLLSILFI